MAPWFGTLASQVRVSLTFDVLRSCGPFILGRFKSCGVFIRFAFFGSAWSKTSEVGIMACLTLQLSELIRSDIASTRLLRDLVVSNVLIREDAFGKEDKSARMGTHCVSVFRHALDR